MKQVFPFFGLMMTGSILMAQPCADPANIYSFTFEGKTYEVIKEKKSWTTAAACAVERGGYLAQINSQAEQNALHDAIINGAGVPVNYVTVNDGGGVAYVWIGAADMVTEGTWIWDGNNDGMGDNFWMGQGTAGAGGGYAVGGNYINWGGTSTFVQKEPDNYGGIQDAGAMALAPWPAGIGSLGIAGEWNDINVGNQIYFIVETDQTGINEPGIAPFILYPNPVSRKLNIILNCGNRIAGIEITASDGKLILSEKTCAASRYSVELGSVTPGCYTAAVTLENGERVFRKFIRID